jgi:hypothetical protein
VCHIVSVSQAYTWKTTFGFKVEINTVLCVAWLARLCECFAVSIRGGDWNVHQQSLLLWTFLQACQKGDQVYKLNLGNSLFQSIGHRALWGSCLSLDVSLYDGLFDAVFGPARFAAARRRRKL